MPATLLVPLDGSSEATAALPVARGLAELCDGTLVIFHVTDDAVTPAALVDRVRLETEDVRGLVVERRGGEPATAITRAAVERDTEVIVMCTRTREDDRRRALSPVAEAVLRTAPCPVVLVPPARGRRPWALRRVLFPHDGTPTTAAAIGPMAALARRAGAEMVVLHVATPHAEPPAEAGSLISPRYVDHPEHEWPAWRREFLARVCGLGRATSQASMRVALVEGEPGEAIVAFTRDQGADLMTLAWRGDLSPGHAGVMRRVLHDAPCPALVLRVPAPRPAGGAPEPQAGDEPVTSWLRQWKHHVRG
jgi:nucleotide-binding universal stress UspA family protein